MIDELRKNPLWLGFQKRLFNPRIWRDSGLLMLANVIVIGLGLVRLPVITRILTKEEVGMLGVVTSVIPFLMLLTLPGMDGAGYHFIAKGYPGAIWVSIRERLRWSILASAGFLIGAVYFWWWRDETAVAWLFVISAVVFPVTGGMTILAGYLGAREKFVALFWYRVGEALARYAGLLLLLLLPVLTFPVVWFSLTNQVTLAFMMVAVSVAIYRVMQRERLPIMPIEVQDEMKKYGRQLSGLNVISTVQTRIDAFLIAALMPLNVVADYSIALLAQGQFKALWHIYLTVRYPAFVRFELDQRKRRMTIEFVFMWIGFAGLWAVSMVLLRWLIPIIFPEEYISSLPFIGWLFGSFVVGVPAYFVEIFFRTIQNETYQYKIRGYAAVFNVILPLILVQVWEAEGIVIGRFLASTAMSFFATFFLWQYHQKNEKQL